MPIYSLGIRSNEWYDQLFQSDFDISTVSWIRSLENLERGYSNSLFLSRLLSRSHKRRLAQYEHIFPRGVPAFSEKENYILETAIDWMVENLQDSSSPYFSYVHLLPPHVPYNTRIDFVDRFMDDGYQPIHKPRHPLGQKPYTYEVQTKARRMYDEFVLYADSEFNRLMDILKQRGILENTFVILTSDHGEMFERGIREHLIPSFHRPLMHIPLVIFPPGQAERVDIHSLTTTIDLMPTILDFAGNPLPEWLEGEILPPFNQAPQSNRTIFSVDFKRSPKSGPITDGSIMIRTGSYKFTHLFGTQRPYDRLPDSSMFELYNLADDPDELDNQFHPDDTLSKTMIEMMEDRIREKNLELIRYN